MNVLFVVAHSLVEYAGGIIGTTALEPYGIRTFGKQVC